MAGMANRSDLENILGSLLQSVTKLTARSFTHFRVGSSFVWFLNGGGGVSSGCDFFAGPFLDNLVKISTKPVLYRRVDLAGRMGIVDQKSPKISSEQLVTLLLEKRPEPGERNHRGVE
jgi:hypothetical protein